MLLENMIRHIKNILNKFYQKSKIEIYTLVQSVLFLLLYMPNESNHLTVYKSSNYFLFILNPNISSVLSKHPDQLECFCEGTTC